MRIILIIVYLLVLGCALSPQEIRISPVLTPGSNEGNIPTRPVSIIVNDTRNSDILGSRGGVYSDTALLRTAADLEQTLKESLQTAFTERGYRISSAANTPRLILELSVLDYNSVRGTALYTITTRATVRASCRHNTTTLNNDYSITDKKDFIKLPSRNENQTIINQTLAAAVNRIFRDQALLQCLDG